MARPLKVTDKNRQLIGLGEGLSTRNNSQSFRLHTKGRKNSNASNLDDLLNRRGSFDDFQRSSSLPITFKNDFTPWESPDM